VTESITIVDGHVHVHANTDVGALLDAAGRNLEAAAASIGVRHWSGVLMLAEMRDARWFESPGSMPSQWTLERVPGDDISAQAISGDYVLYIVAGRQVVTSEGVEVLTLATREVVPDGLSLPQTLEAASRTGALVVLPWGAGKWLGARGKLVKETIDTQASLPLFAGDNGGRPVFWPEPEVFTVARNKGRPVLPGTDPLPIPAEERRVGSFGFWLDGAVSGTAPGSELRDRVLKADPGAVRVFGQLQHPLRFVLNQAALRMKPKAPKQNGHS
jgi:hypothetical protein